MTVYQMTAENWLKVIASSAWHAYVHKKRCIQKKDKIKTSPKNPPPAVSLIFPRIGY